jgi:hypothetical protein
MTVGPVALDVRKTDNFPADLAERMLAGYNRVGSFWADVAKPERPVIVRMGTEKDLDWWRQQIGHLGPMYDAIVRGYETSGAYSNSANSYNDGPQFSHQFTFGTLIPAEAQRHAITVTVPHEFTHSIQAATGGSLNALPCWFAEGHANVYGVAIGAESSAARVEERVRTLRRELPMSGSWPTTDPAVMAGALKSAESKNGYSCPRSSYSLGMMAVEALIAVHGHGRVNDFMVTSRGQTWVPAFTAAFGLSPDAFYQAVAPYLIATGSDSLRS